MGEHSGNVTDKQYSPTPPITARRQASSAVPSVLTAAISKVVRRGPLDSDDELSSARVALDKLEGTWNGAAVAITNLSKARRGEYMAENKEKNELICQHTHLQTKMSALNS
jgi:hypothetical protein